MIKITAPKDRDVSLASTAGITIRLKAGTSRTAQPMFAQAAAVAGCAVSFEEDAPPPAPDAEEREKQFEEAVRAVVAKADPDDFTAAGRPRKAAVQAHLDWEFTGAELTKVFDSLVSESG